MSHPEFKSSLSKYKPLAPIHLPNRQWPSNHIQQSPIWCSVDLRDGNQALVNPMSVDQKIMFFDYLVSIGFKEIEVGFPAASSVEFEFVRAIIEQNKIPDDVHIQVLTQARPHLIERTLESIQGANHAIVHLYNSTSIAQRKYVFDKSTDEIINIALTGIHDIKKHLNANNKNVILQYSPESFTGTEIDFSIDICNHVIDAWDVSTPIIINLPATVELFSPNIYADMIEYASNQLNRRSDVILSVHTHNDRGTGIAATELALLAGAQRVEGTLFGNGERTGNLDITTMALNLYSHGIDPELNISNIPEMIQVYQSCTQMEIDPRHPYAGELVFTAFSGSHQDAIKKGMHGYKQNQPWDIPYLTIDPNDIGREYKAIIRINSQSGKGGVAFIMESDYNCIIPKDMQPELSKVIQSVAEQTGKEVDSSTVWNMFESEFINCDQPISLNQLTTDLLSDGSVTAHISITIDNTAHKLNCTGNGPIDASKKALAQLYPELTVHNYSEHSLSQGSDSQAICYIKVEYQHHHCYGVGLDSNITIASVKALISALNRIIVQSKL